MRIWTLGILALAAFAVLTAFRIRVFMAGGKAMLALAAIVGLGILLLWPAPRKK